MLYFTYNIAAGGPIIDILWQCSLYSFDVLLKCIISIVADKFESIPFVDLFLTVLTNLCWQTIIFRYLEHMMYGTLLAMLNITYSISQEFIFLFNFKSDLSEYLKRHSGTDLRRYGNGRRLTGFLRHWDQITVLRQTQAARFIKIGEINCSEIHSVSKNNMKPHQLQ